MQWVRDLRIGLKALGWQGLDIGIEWTVTE